IKIMKKLILTAAITLTAIAGAFAQDAATATTTTTTNPGPKTATANLSVTINPIQTIEILNPTVNLNYLTTNDYDRGVTSTKENHLKIYSTGAFQVKVTASDLTEDGTDKKIEASGITVKADIGSAEPLDHMAGNEKAVKLSGTASTIFTSNTGGVNRNVNITYHGAGGNDYLNKYFDNTGKKNVYSTDVIYSIEAM